MTKSWSLKKSKSFSIADMNTFPKDTESKIYIVTYGYFSFSDLSKAIAEKWPHTNHEDLRIEHERIKISDEEKDEKLSFLNFEDFIVITNTKYCQYCKSCDPKVFCGKCSCGENGHLKGFGPGTFLVCDRCYETMVEDYHSEENKTYEMEEW